MENMMRSLILSCLLVPAIAAHASTDKPTDAELNDWMTFLRSESLSVTPEICTPLLSGKADYAAVATQWLAAHQAEIARGKAFAQAGLPKDRNFEEYHAAMAEDFKLKLSAKPETAKIALCTESLNALQKGLAASGA